MTLRRLCRRHASIGLVAVALTASSLTAGIIAQNASAAPSTKYYTSTATPSSVDVSSTRAPVTFTLGNCDSICGKGSTQSWGSAHVTLPLGWDWGTVSTPSVHTANGSDSPKSSHWTSSSTGTDSAGNRVVALGNDGTSSTYAIAPGEYLTFTALLLPTAPGLAAITTQVKQSNDFSGSGNDFLHTSGNTDPTIVIGPPDHLEFGVPPQTVQVTTSATDVHYMCDESNRAPSVKVVDKDGNLVTWVSTTVTLSSTGAPGLKYKATSTS